MQASTSAFPSLAHRVAHPSPQARAERAHLRRSRAIQRARAELGRMTQRMQALAANQHELRELTRIAEAEVPNAIDEASWGGDIEELADKIQRESWGLLEATEAPVRNADRQIVLKNLPPSIEVSRDDVHYTK